jgi:hypothetical protein
MGHGELCRKDGKDGVNGVGIKDIKSHGNDIRIELTNGKGAQFRLAGGGATPLGGGGKTLTPGDGVVIDSGVISVKRTWTDYVTRWDTIPVLTGAGTAPVAGDVYAYTLGGVTRYRLVPTAYAPGDDMFYESFAGGECTGALAARTEP